MPSVADRKPKKRGRKPAPPELEGWKFAPGGLLVPKAQALRQRQLSAPGKRFTYLQRHILAVMWHDITLKAHRETDKALLDSESNHITFRWSPPSWEEQDLIQAVSNTWPHPEKRPYPHSIIRSARLLTNKKVLIAYREGETLEELMKRSRWELSFRPELSLLRNLCYRDPAIRAIIAGLTNKR